MNHYRQKNRRTAFALLLLALVILIFPKSAYALSVSPARLEVVGDPGKTVTEEMLIINEAEDTQTLYPSFANFEAEGDSGNPVFVEPTGDLGSWMDIGGPITLKAGESKEVTLTIHVPHNAEAGGHFAAVFWGTTPPTGSGGVSVGSRVGSLVLLSVSGEIEESFGLVDFQTQEGKWFYTMLPVGFEYRFANQGGDRVKPVATITVRSILGWRVKKVDANPFEGNVLPNTTRRFAPEWAKRNSVADTKTYQGEKYSFTKAVAREWHNFAIGIFKAKLSTEFGTAEQRTTSKAVVFVVFPWELLIVLLPGAYILYRLLRFFIKRYNRSIIRGAQKRLAREQGL